MSIFKDGEESKKRKFDLFDESMGEINSMLDLWNVATNGIDLAFYGPVGKITEHYVIADKERCQCLRQIWLIIQSQKK